MVQDSADLRSCVQRLELDKLELKERVAELESQVKKLQSSNTNVVEVPYAQQSTRLFSKLFEVASSSSKPTSQTDNQEIEAPSGELPASSDLLSRLVNKVSEQVQNKVRSDNLRSSNVVLIGVRASSQIPDMQQVARIFRNMGAPQHII